MMEQMTGLDAQLSSGSCRKLQRREGRGNPLRQQSPPNLFGRDLIMEDSFSMDREGVRGCFLDDSSALYLLCCHRSDRRQSSGSNVSDGE